MVSLMGTRTVLCGLRPGVAAALVNLNVATEGLQTSLSLDRALDTIAATESGDANVAAIEGIARSGTPAMKTRETRVSIENEMDVTRAVLETVSFCAAVGIDRSRGQMVATAVSELARNILKYRVARRRDPSTVRGPLGTGRNRSRGRWTGHRRCGDGHAGPFQLQWHARTRPAAASRG